MYIYHSDRNVFIQIKTKAQLLGEDIYWFPNNCILNKIAITF